MSRKFASTSLAASCAALLLAACGGGGGSTSSIGPGDGGRMPPGPTEMEQPDPTEMEQRADAQRTAITTTAGELETALAALSTTNPTARQVQDVEQAVTQLTTALTNADDVPNDDASKTMAQEQIATARNRISAARNRIDPAEQHGRSTSIVSRADSLIASSIYEKRGSAAVTDYKPSCTGTICTFTSPTEPPQSDRLRDNFDINLANPTTTSESLGAKHNITLIQSTWSSADLPNPAPTENLNYTVFGAWMEHSVFFVSVTQGQFSGDPYNSNRSVAAGRLSNSRPSGNATWQGRMVGTLLSETNRGDKLQGDAALTYSLDSQSLNAAFTAIQNLDMEAGPFLPPVEFRGVPVDGKGGFEQGPRGGSASQAWLHGAFYGPDHREAAGVFRSANIVGAFGAKQQ